MQQVFIEQMYLLLTRLLYRLLHLHPIRVQSPLILLHCLHLLPIIQLLLMFHLLTLLLLLPSPPLPPLIRHCTSSPTHPLLGRRTRFTHPT